MSATITSRGKNQVVRIADRAREYFAELQKTICSELERVDGSGRFSSEQWSREEGGGGLTRVMEEGTVFEKAGVNTSTVFGAMSEQMARRMAMDPARFYATGISLVIHPRSPMIPTVHMNCRYIEQGEHDAWFGGGSDLTPYYLYDEDVISFHRALKSACDPIDRSYYPRLKKWCDEYFVVRHRKEGRGVGGVFFDYMRDDPEKHFALVRAVGDAFLESYVPIVRRRMNEPWGEPERNWQLVRRGRYVEFNLIYDRGTTFGLETQGRIESILMSLPPHVAWRYNVEPPPGSREAALVDVLKNPRDWLG